MPEKTQIEILMEQFPGLKDSISDGIDFEKEEQVRIKNDYEFLGKNPFKTKTFEVITGKLHFELMTMLKKQPLREIDVAIKKVTIKTPDITRAELMKALTEEHKIDIDDVIAYNSNAYYNEKHGVSEMAFYYEIFQAIINPLGLKDTEKELINTKVLSKGKINPYWMEQDYNLIKKKVLFFRKRYNLN